MNDTIYTKKYVTEYLEAWEITLSRARENNRSGGAIKICEDMVKYYSDLAETFKKSEKVKKKDLTWGIP